MLNQKGDTCFNWTIYSVIFIIIASGTTFGILKNNIYNKHYITVSGTGELSVRHFVYDLSTILCGHYKISTWKDTNTYITSGEARIDKVNRGLVTRDAEQLFPLSMNVDNSFYLLEGSFLELNACRIHDSPYRTDDIVHLLIFKGDDSWNTFTNGDGTNWAVKDTTLPLDAYCRDNRDVLMTYTVIDRDSYRVTVVSQRNGYITSYIPVRAELNINRTIFDTTNAPKICKMTSECVVPLQYNHDTDIVVSFYGDIHATTHCQLGVMFCVGIFFILPTCLIIPIITCCAVVISGERKKRNLQVNSLNLNTENVDVNHKFGLVKNELPPQV